MKKETEEKVKTIIGIFAFIGIFSTIAFVYDLFDKDDSNIDTTICEEYLSKIENLEIEIDELKSDLYNEEEKNKELKSEVEVWKEEYYLLKEIKGCDTSGGVQTSLTDGPASN